MQNNNNYIIFGNFRLSKTVVFQPQLWVLPSRLRTAESKLSMQRKLWFALVIKRSRAGFLLSCFPSAHLSICSTAFHGFDGSQGDLQCCNFIPKHLETITARISFTLRFITGYFNSVQCCSLRHPNYMRTLTLGRPRTVRARSFFIIEGHVGVRDGHQIHVFPRGPECGELTKADPLSFAYSCLCDDRETPRDLPCPLHPLP